MFGTYRLALALAVVCQHLLCIPVVGHHAVHGFFILSGFLMTLIMHESYGYNARGIRAFCTNRFLRLYPIYWFVLAVSAGIVIWFGESDAILYREYIRIPDTLASWIQNLSLVYFAPFPGTVSPRLSPPTWALTLELCFYLLIALGASRTQLTTKLWLIASLIFTASTYVFGLSHDYRYGFIFAASLPFALGGYLYHHKNFFVSLTNRLPVWISPVTLGALFIVNAAVSAGSRLVGDLVVVEEVGNLFNLVIQFVLISQLLTRKWPVISQSLDKRLGDYSYPIYIAHWQIAFATSMAVYGEPIRGRNVETIIICLVSMIPLLAVSWIGLKFIDGYTNRIRVKIKNRICEENDEPRESSDHQADRPPLGAAAGT